MALQPLFIALVAAALNLFAILVVLVTLTNCSHNDNAHTTVTIPIAPPPHQVLSVVNG